MRQVTEPFLEELTSQVYAYVQPDGGWCLSNSGLVIGAGAPLLIDTAATETRTRALRAAVESVAQRPPGLLVNTHHHGDHTHEIGRAHV